MRLQCGAVTFGTERPDLSFQDSPLMPIRDAPDAIVQFPVNGRKKSENPVVSARKVGGRWHDGLIGLKTMIGHSLGGQ